MLYIDHHQWCLMMAFFPPIANPLRIPLNLVDSSQILHHISSLLSYDQNAFNLSYIITAKNGSFSLPSASAISEAEASPISTLAAPSSRPSSPWPVPPERPRFQHICFPLAPRREFPRVRRDARVPRHRQRRDAAIVDLAHNGAEYIPPRVVADA